MARDTAQIGDVIDSRYRITGVLGTGGMGSVYRAEHVKIRRPVAVKLLHKDLAEDASFAARFEREAFATGQVTHPNCVTVSDFGKLEDGSLYLVMELLDGVILADVLEEAGRIEIRRALHIARHVLRGLKHAHRHDIVHRDVKPDNVVLVENDDDRDFAKLLDFGIAKLVGEAQAAGGDNNQLTRVGTTVGTPTYVAPEQAFGQPVDPRADLYSLTVMLFEMIAGQPPFSSEDTLKLLSMHVGGTIPRLVDRAPDLEVPEPVEALIRKGLEKSRDDRFATAADYIAAIDTALEDLRARESARLQSAGAAHPGTEPTDYFAGQTPIPRPATPQAQQATPVPQQATPVPQRDTPLPRAASAPPQGSGATQVLPAPHRILTRGRLAALGAGALLLIIIAAVAGSGDGAPEGAKRAPSPGPSPLVAPASKDPTKHSKKAKTLLGRDDPRAAIAYLEKRADAVAYDAHAQLQLGHAYAAVDRAEDAAHAYRRAVDLDGELTSDEKLLKNARALTRASNPEARLAALELAAVTLELEEGKRRLVEAASSAKDTKLRRGARELAAGAGLLDQVDLVHSYALDLRQEESCEERKPYVARLRQLDDKRAIRPLRRARNRKKGGVLGIGGKRVNDCLRDEAAEAIEYLKSL